MGWGLWWGVGWGLWWGVGLGLWCRKWVCSLGLRGGLWWGVGCGLGVESGFVLYVCAGDYGGEWGGE